MARLFSVVVDCQDHIAQARWWADAFGTPVAGECEDEAWLVLDTIAMEFVPVDEPKEGKNRTHFDLATYSEDEYAWLVESLVTAGAREIDIGQPAGADWTVLADPEGNEFCVVAPRPLYDYRTPLASIAIETANAARTCDFWEKASAWRRIIREPTFVILRAPSGDGPYLLFGDEFSPKRGKNRIHLDVAPDADEDQAEAVDDLVAAGARRIDIGQGEVSRVVLEDPGGNEFCVLTPR